MKSIGKYYNSILKKVLGQYRVNLIINLLRIGETGWQIEY